MDFATKVNIVKYFILAWFIIYVSVILKNIHTVREIAKCIHILVNYLNSAKLYPYSAMDKQKDYLEHLNTLLEFYPVISKYTNFYSKTLSYSHSDIENYNNAHSLYMDFCMLHNFKIQELKESFNPFISAKFIVSFPSNLVSWLGFKPKETSRRIINLLGWIVAYILGLYSAEVKSLIDSLLQKFIHT